VKEETKRTLYECFNARVKGDRIFCGKGYPFLSKSQDGSIGIRRLSSGKQLAFQVCQECPDFDEMGSAIPVNERGWLNIRHGR
jgi:hypothetical protein